MCACIYAAGACVNVYTLYVHISMHVREYTWYTHICLCVLTCMCMFAYVHVVYIGMHVYMCMDMH